jgi:orotidine-5'-phosphate decarboxylase
MARLRQLAPAMPLLVPGVGAQGGDLEAAVVHLQDAAGRGLLINSSRSVIYASSGDDFAQAARRAALRLRDQINRYRKA